MILSKTPFVLVTNILHLVASFLNSPIIFSTISVAFSVNSSTLGEIIASPFSIE